MAEYPDSIKTLIDTILKFDIHFEVPERTSDLNEIFFRKLVAAVQNKELVFFVDDEYEDVDHKNPVFLFNMILLEAESIAITDSFEEWCSDVGLSQSEPLSDRIYSTNKSSSEQLAELLPTELSPVPNYEIEFGTSVAHLLRNASIER